MNKSPIFDVYGLTHLNCNGVAVNQILPVLLCAVKQQTESKCNL